MKLQLAEGLALPLDFATKTAAILAQRRKGKTYTASVIAEEMVAAKQPFVALDPTGAWWGLRAGADGKSEGLPVVVLGGQHGDVPLERTGGRLIADLVVEAPGYYVIDFSLFESGEAERQFAVDFAERLYRAKGQPGRDFPLHLFVDEADRFIPQQMRKGSSETSPRLLGAFEAIVRRGGLRGLGTTLISQRAAVVNKNVLEMLDILFALRTVGPNDRDAIASYIEAHGTAAEREAMMGSLASLDIGEAWVWEPGAEPPLFQRVRIRQRRTFNSSATPKPGERRVEPKRLAAVDLAALHTRMAATIEKAKADDPRELRRQIAELKKQVLDAVKESGRNESIRQVKRVEVLTDADRALLEKLTAAIADRAKKASEILVAAESRADRLVQTAVAEYLNTTRNVTIDAGRELEQILDRVGFQKILGKLAAIETPAESPRQPAGTRAVSAGRSSAATRPTETRAPRVSDGSGLAGVSSNGSVTGAEKRILNALAELEALGVPEPERVQVAFFAGYTHLNSKGLVNALGALRSTGFIDYPTQGRVVMTDAGQAHAEAVDVPRTPDELRDRVVRMLGGASARILEPLIKAYPKAMAREDLAAAASYGHLNSKGFVNALGRLRSLGFIDYPSQGQVAAQPVLFLE
jgi:uncharacterized protein